MNRLGLSIDPFLLIGGGLLLMGLFVMRFIQTVRRYKAIVGASQSQQAQSPNPFAEAEGPLSEKPMAQYLHTRVLKNEPFPGTNAVMLKPLLCHRFPFTAGTLGPEFPATMMNTMKRFPPVLIQLLDKHRVPIEMDVVCDIPAMMDPVGPKLMISRLFVMDNQLFRTEENPVYPYDLSNILLHELGHFLDWFILPEQGRRSATEVFQSAFREDVAAIPAALKQSYEESEAMLRKHGGYLKLPKAQRQQSDVSLFVNQEEEVFGEAFAHLITGEGRPAVTTYFPKSIAAVSQLLQEAFEQISYAPQAQAEERLAAS